jgi:hypothetical protein
LDLLSLLVTIKGEQAMRTIETMAIYEDGVLRSSAPLALPEHTSLGEPVQVPTSEDAAKHSRRVDAGV